MSCPNKNLQEWKDLAERVGETEAYGLWDWYNSEVPEGATLQTIVKESILEQDKTVPASVANAQTVETMKKVAVDMEVSMISLEEYAKINPAIETSGVNGIADLTKKTIAIAEGRDSEAITEEVVHIASAIIEQTDPRMVTAMLSKIGKFKIYDIVLQAYKGKKGYQLPDGRPDIRKIKKEAVDKLIAEVIIQKSEDKTTFPELMEENTVNEVKGWWRKLLDSIRGLYAKSNIDIFKDAADKIIEGGFGTVSDINTEGVFEQSATEGTAQSMIDSIMGVIANFSDKTEFHDEVGDGIGPNRRHYTYDGVDVARSVTEKVKQFNPFTEREGDLKIADDDKRDWGTAGHEFIEEYILTNLVDKETNLARKDFLKVPINTKLEPRVVSALKDFSEKLVRGYATGTRFLLEEKVVNVVEKGKLASKIDFMAIEPVEIKGKPDFRVDILDWKFTSIAKKREDDIPWFKQKDWKSQMGEYTTILRNYGVEPKQIRKARMIPFIMNYIEKTKGTPSDGLYANKIEIGNLDSLKETTLYLLPVPTEAESTGNAEVDKLLGSLNAHYKKIWEKRISTDLEKIQKNEILNSLSSVIRKLQMNLDFTPLKNLGEDFLKRSDEILKGYEKLDYDKLTLDETNNKLSELIEMKNSAAKFTEIDSVFLSQYPREGLTKEMKATFDTLEKIASSTERMLPIIDKYQSSFAVYAGVKSGYTDLKNKFKVLLPQKKLQGIAKAMLEGSGLSNHLIRITSNLILRAASVVDIKFIEQSKQYEDILIPLEQEASASGKSAFELIGKVTDPDKNGEQTLELIEKLDSKFTDKMDKALQDSDIDTIKKNIDTVAYKKAADKIIAKHAEYLKTAINPQNKSQEDNLDYQLKKLSDSLDINSKDFNGFNDFQFRTLVTETQIIKGNTSAEYNNMSEAARKVWEWFTAMNKSAQDMGYLQGGNKRMSFFPLMEATALQRMSLSKQGLGADAKDFFVDLGTVRIDEEANFGKTDLETGKIKKQIPTFFTASNKEVTKLSTDLNLIGNLWMKSLLDYKSNKMMENTLLTLHAVEKSKGMLIEDEKKRLIPDGRGGFRSSTQDNTNAELLEEIIDDAIYGLGEVAGFADSAFTSIADKFSKTEEDVERKQMSVKKMIESSNMLIKILGVGLSPGVAVANWFGQQFHSYILQGNHYTGREYRRLHRKLMTFDLSTEQKALMNMVLPLQENVVTERRRDVALRTSTKSYLETWTFTDAMMVSNSAPEKALQWVNGLAFFENALLIKGEDGKTRIVGAIQYQKEINRKKNEAKGTVESRLALKESFEADVENLKSSHGLLKNMEVAEDGSVNIPGMTKEESHEELGKFRVKILDYARKLNGQMDPNDKASYRRNVLGRSFMMFKGWIPKFVHGRFQGINRNLQQDTWEYGRTRLFVSTMTKYVKFNISKMTDILTANENGRKMMDQMLAEKVAERAAEGETLDITQEEFYELVAQEMNSMIRELQLLVSITSLLLAFKAAAPDDDATLQQKNMYKHFSRMFHKVQEELQFYYSPDLFQSISRTNIIPSLSLLGMTAKAFKELGKQSYGYLSGDEKLMDKANPIKYFMNIIPIGKQFNKEILPLAFPEIAKDLGYQQQAEIIRR
jgi:hypothetical protein